MGAHLLRFMGFEPFTLPPGLMAFRSLTMTAVCVCSLAHAAGAQTDYYNTDAGRPLAVEDAYTTERYAFEWQIAPLRLERAPGGVYHWGFEPEFAYGILPRTHVEIGAPLAFIDAAGTRMSGLAGLDLSLFHNLNVETRLPALAFGVQVLAPIGGLAPDKAYPSFKGIATRTFTWARFHLNGEYTIGEEPAASAGALELSRWFGGIAVDKTYPLRSLLIGAEVNARQPIHEIDEVEWTVAVGLRKQISPQFNLDGGVGRRLTGGTQSWFATFGLAYAFGIPALMRVSE
jgi:hypothetical protein